MLWTTFVYTAYCTNCNWLSKHLYVITTKHTERSCGELTETRIMIVIHIQLNLIYVEKTCKQDGEKEDKSKYFQSRSSNNVYSPKMGEAATYINDRIVQKCDPVSQIANIWDILLVKPFPSLGHCVTAILWKITEVFQETHQAEILKTSWIFNNLDNNILSGS